MKKIQRLKSIHLKWIDELSSGKTEIALLITKIANELDDEEDICRLKKHLIFQHQLVGINMMFDNILKDIENFRLSLERYITRHPLTLSSNYYHKHKRMQVKLVSNLEKFAKVKRQVKSFIQSNNKAVNEKMGLL